MEDTDYDGYMGFAMNGDEDYDDKSMPDMVPSTPPTDVRVPRLGGEPTHLSSSPSWREPETPPPTQSVQPASADYDHDHHDQQHFPRRPRLAAHSPPRGLHGQNHNRKSSFHRLHEHIHPSFPDQVRFDQSLHRGQDLDPDLDPDSDSDFVEISGDEPLEVNENGNLVTRREVQAQLVKVAKESGKFTCLVAQATAEWWLSPEMRRRKRVAAQRLLDASGAVALGAGNVLMNNTPLGRVTAGVANNVNAFRAAPFRYTMQGIGMVKKEEPVSATPNAEHGQPRFDAAHVHEAERTNPTAETSNNPPFDSSPDVEENDDFEEFGFFAGLPDYDIDDL